MATQDDRSLGSGSFFPKWMKNKMDNKFDLNQSAFSPTELDDSFMYYYRHPNAGAVKVMDGQVVTASSNQITSGQADFSNITAVDQTLLSNTVQAPAAPTPTDLNRLKPRPKGTDDGFKGETAKVGSAVIRVANQMVSGKIIKGAPPAKPEEECEQLLAKFDPYRRRGSKSLPASPLATPETSPKSKRRMNKFFTGPFVDTEQHKGSWILSNLLAKREFSKSFGHIHEETKEEMDRASSMASIDGEFSNSNSKSSKQTVYKAKPSELREMNFWSPTSM